MAKLLILLATLGTGAGLAYLAGRASAASSRAAAPPMYAYGGIPGDLSPPGKLDTGGVPAPLSNRDYGGYYENPTQ